MGSCELRSRTRSALLVMPPEAGAPGWSDEGGKSGGDGERPDRPGVSGGAPVPLASEGFVFDVAVCLRQRDRALRSAVAVMGIPPPVILAARLLCGTPCLESSSMTGSSARTCARRACRARSRSSIAMSLRGGGVGDFMICISSNFLLGCQTGFGGGGAAPGVPGVGEPLRFPRGGRKRGRQGRPARGAACPRAWGLSFPARRMGLPPGRGLKLSVWAGDEPGPRMARPMASSARSHGVRPVPAGRGGAACPSAPWGATFPPAGGASRRRRGGLKLWVQADAARRRGGGRAAPEG